MSNPTIFSFIEQKESEFESEKMQLGDNWHWNFRDHVQMIFHLKNGVFYTGENDYMRAFKAVMRPLLRLSYWTEDIEVKDVTFFIEGKDDRALSFLIKKYHDEVYVREHDIDSLFDNITESDIDYGGALVQSTGKGKPEFIPLNAIAFCDQTNILGGPIGIKFFFSPDGLRKMSNFGWGKESNGATMSLDELAILADEYKDPTGTDNKKKNKVTGKTVEVYIVRGNLPEAYLKDNDNMEDWYNQVQIVAFYSDNKGKKQNAILYRKSEDEGMLKFHKSEDVYNRALGYSDGEMLIHPQIWTNFLSIHKNALLESASKIIPYTDDPTFAQKNDLREMENLQVAEIEEGKTFGLVPTVGAVNIQLLSSSIDEWFSAAQLDSAAFDPILGKEQSSGTTFRGQERTVAQGRGWHDRRRGKRAKFIEQLYREDIIPNIIKEITKGKKFLATLTAEEITWIVEQLANNYANDKLKKSLMDFKKPLMTEEERNIITQTFKEEFGRGGNVKLVEILADEFKDAPIRMGINVANKQKDLSMLSDKVLSIFQFIFANPAGFQQAMQMPALAKSFQDILEFSGLNQSDFMSLVTMPPAPQQALPPQQGQPAPTMQLTKPTPNE